MARFDPDSSPVALIVNTHSRRGRTLFRKARRKLDEAGIEIARAVPLRNPANLSRAVKAAVDGGAKLLIVGGGDGSISGAVDGLVGTDCALALLPLGTANSFARTLGIPLDLDGAIAVIRSGRLARIDLGMIDTDYFANVAAIGMPSLIAATIPDGLKRIMGRAGYMLWATWRLIRFRPFDVTITGADGLPRRFRAVELRIANGNYLGGAEVTEEAAVDSGDIVVQVVTGGGRLSLGWNWLATVLKLPIRRQTTETIRGANLRIETSPPLPLSVDGEVTVRTPVTAGVARQVIDVMVPSAG